MSLDPTTFDLIEALSEANFPEHEVTVYTDEAIGFSVYTLEKARALAELADDAEARIKKIEAELKKIKKEAKTKALKVTLRGVSQERRELILSVVDEEMPDEKDALGRIKDNPKKDLRIREELWKAYIVKVENSKGEIAIPDTEGNAIRAFLKLGETTALAINNGISELRSGTHSGFEIATQDVDFL